MRAHIALFALLASIYVLSASPDYYPGDDRYYLNLAGQMVERGTVALRTSSDRVDPDAAFRGADGRVYTKYTPGHPAALAIVFACVKPLERRLDAETYAFVQRLAFSLVPSCLVALALALAAWHAGALGYRTSTCLIWALGLGLGTNLWPATKTLLSEPTQAFLVTAIGVLAMRALARDDLATAALLGAACGWAFVTKITLALTFPVAIAVLFARPRARARVAAFALPLLIGLAAIGAYNVARTGRLFVLGYESGQDLILGFPTPWWAGLHGLLFSSGKGLFFYSPFLALALFGARAFLSRHRGPGRVVLALVIPHLMLYSTWNCWHGDWSWGPRFLVTIHVLAGFLALPLVERLRGRRALALVLVLGIAVQLLGVLLEPFTYIEIVKALPIGVGADKLVDTAPEKPFVIDGLLHNHYLPSFSPLAGHLWLLARLVIGPRPDDHPWAWMQSRVLAPREQGVRTDLWWVRPTSLDVEPTQRACLALAVLILGAAAFALARSWPVDEVSPPAPDPAPDPAPPEASPALLASDVRMRRYAELTLLIGIAAYTVGDVRTGAARAGARLANHLALALTAILTGRAAARVARDDGEVDASGVAAATTMLTVAGTMLWSQTISLSPAVPSALATAILLQRALASPSRARTLAALAGIAAVSALSAWHRGPGPMPAWQGLYALTLSPGRSLVPYAPVVLLAFPRLARRDATAAFLTAAALIPLAIEALTGAWMNDAGWGPTGLAPSLVALLIAAAPGPRRTSAASLLALLASLLIGAASLAVPPSAYLELQARVPGLFPPGHAVFQRESRHPLAGVTFVPDLSPVPGQLWMAGPRTSPPPWTGQFWRGYEPR